MQNKEDDMYFRYNRKKSKSKTKIIYYLIKILATFSIYITIYIYISVYLESRTILRTEKTKDYIKHERENIFLLYESAMMSPWM